MNAAGIKGSGLANKYRSKGLRVIAVDADGRSLGDSTKKWKAVGADFYLYDGNMNCLRKLKQFSNSNPFSYGFPYDLAIKEWEGKKIYATEEDIKNAFGF